MEQQELKDMMNDFQDLLENTWYFVRTRDSKILSGQQELDEKYIKDLHKKWEQTLSKRFLM